MRKLSLGTKRFFSLALALAVLFSAMAPALGAETVSDAASTIQLTKTEGDVSVTNRSGRTLSVRRDMRLYNGYHAETEDKSYAWINLDSSKLIKLDAVSEAEVRKSGKKLEVLLDSGNLYFDISQPLDQTESLNIRTSTMIVGIRGTCGWVKMFDAWHAQVYLLEGQVECAVTDPATGESRTTVLQGGETAEFVVYPQGQTGERCDIIRQTYSEEKIDGFVLVELVKDRPLCEKIYADSSLDVLGRYDQDSAQQRLEEDQAAMGEKLEQIEKAQSTQDNHVSQDPVWNSGSQDNSSSEDSGSSGGGSSGGGSTPPAESGTVTLTMPVTDMEVQQALNRPATQQVVVLPGAAPATLDIGINMTVDSGKTLTLNSGVPAQVLGSLTVNGTADLGDDLTNDGTVTVNSANTLRVAGSLTNNRTMIVTATGRSITEGTFTNSAGASLALTEGAQVLARNFVLTAPVEGWGVSGTQSDGYYRLEAVSEPEPEPGVTVGDFTVSGGTLDTDYSYADGVLTILTATALTIRNANPDTATTDHILVADGVSANVTLAGVNIDTSNVSGGAAAFAIAPGSTGNVTVTLADGTTNTLASPGTHAGLETTAREGGGGGMLTITGTGTLAAGSVYAGSGTDVSAGIGAPYLRPTGNITIAGGTLSGSSGYGAPFIGEYNGTSTSDLTATLRITGGTITGDITVINKANLTVSGGTVTGNISASSFDMSDGTVNGAVSGITDSFTISGGEIVSDAKKDYTVSVDQTATVHLNGGTITNNCTSEASGRYGAIFITESISAIEGEIKTDIRGKKDDLMALCRLTPDTLYGPFTPDGYAVRGPADDGYYHLVYAPTGDFTVTGGTKGVDYDFAFTYFTESQSYGDALTILTATPLTIQNTDPSAATDDCILVNDGVNANVTLAGVNIDVRNTGTAGSSSEEGYFGEAAFKAGIDSTTTVTLAGGTTNTLRGGHGRAGLEAGETENSTLIVGGSGALNATGGIIYTYQELGSYYSSGSGVGIGASYGNGPGNIVIKGGSITLPAYDNIGIGSATLPEGAWNSIQITGGTITGPGAKGESPSSERSIITRELTISGGTVNGDIAATSFNMSEGTVNGRIILAINSSFTISGGEIVSNVKYTVEAAPNLKSESITINLNGGTITNNSTNASGSYGAILISQYTTINGEVNTDICGKNSEALIVQRNSTTNYTPYIPDGYAVTGPDETGYYHLTPWIKTTINYQNATAEAIQTAFESSDEVYLATNSTNTIFIYIADDLTIPAGKMLSVEENSRLVISQDGVSAPTFTVNGTLKVGTELGVYGVLNIAEGGVVEVPSNVYVYNGASIQNSGRFVMRFSGRALVGYTGSSIVNNATGTLEALEPNELSAASVTNSGTISNFYNITGLTMLGGEITANTTGAILFLTDSTSLRGGIITQENPDGAVARYPAAEYTLPETIGTTLRGKGTALLKDSGGTDVTETKGYTAELWDDGYYHLIKEETP